MNKRCILVFSLIIAVVICIVPAKSANASEDSWVSKTSMHEARGRLGVAVVEGKIYAIGGSTAGGQFISGGFVGTNEEYDPATDTWITKAPMPTPRYSFAVAVYQGKIYCIGGMNNAATAANEVYDPATNNWTTKAPLPRATWQVQANVLEDKIYVVDTSGTNYVYDPTTDNWTTKTAIPNKASNYASTVVDNKIYVIGGYTDAPVFVFTLNQIYDPLIDNWSQGAAAPSSVAEGAAGVTTGVLAPKRIYVMGVQGFAGPGAPPCLNRVYDPEKNTWINGTTMPTYRLNFGIAVVNDILYVIGGYTYDTLGFIYPSSLNEQYTPIGYGTVTPPSPSPSLSSSPYLTPTPSPSPSPSPCPPPTPTAPPSETSSSVASPSPSAAQEPQQPAFPAELVTAIAAAAAIAAVIAVAVLLKIKRH